MTLNEKQATFTSTLGKFLVWCAAQGHQVILAEVFRPPEQARLMAEQKKGIRNSLHTKKLAADLFLMKNQPQHQSSSTISWDPDDYKALGDKWKSMHELARWGGDFKGRDAVHFSFEHNGVK